MRVLGIDQSYTHCGCVILDEEKYIHAALISTDDSFDKPTRAWQISQIILSLVRQYNPDCIALEGLAFGMRGDATRDLAGLQFVIINVLRFIGEYKNNILIVSPLTAKKFATGSGKAEKEQMIEKLPKDVREYFDSMGVKKSTGLKDLSDAYWITRVASDPNFKTQIKKKKEKK